MLAQAIDSSVQSGTYCISEALPRFGSSFQSTIKSSGKLKAGLWYSLAMKMLRRGFTVLYRSIFDTVTEMIQAENFGEGGKTMNRYLKVDLLIIDDMGIKKLPKAIA